MQTPALDDTIVAASSGWRASPLGIVRLSGVAAFELAETVGAVLGGGQNQRRTGCRESLVTPGDGLDLPATVYWFRSPHSYTGQDLVEIHTVGSLPALRALSARLIELGARRALPGEFTARAFMNGRLEADQVDQVLALIEAEDQAAARQAARSRRDSEHARVGALNEQLTDLIALVETGIDFVEEEDVQFITPVALRRSIDELIEAISALRRSVGTRGPVEKPHVALAGLPNAGKSTLFNALLGNERAIVSPVLGTTRDVLSAKMEIGDVEFILQDCAGLGASTDELESAAHLAAERSADQADLVLWVHDCTAPWTARESDVCCRLQESRRVLLISKLDQRAGRQCLSAPIPFAGTVELSAATAFGLGRLRQIVGEMLATLGSGDSSGARAHEIERTRAALARARGAVDESGASLTLPELVAFELREAWEVLKSVSRGRLAEEVLGKIFARFCIGK